MTTLLFIAGCALVVAGIAQIYIPAAYVAGGVGMASTGVLLERASRRRDLRP